MIVPLLAVVLSAATMQAPAQAPRPSRLGHGPDSIPDLSNRLVAVFGLPPLNDSAVVALQRRGLRVADRSPAAIERARREKRRLEAAHYGVLVEVRYDSVARARILVAHLLDVETTSRLRMTSVLFPPTGAWGGAMDSVLTHLLAQPRRR